MNTINFKTLKIKNFKSVGSEEVEINFDDIIGMTYVLGENLDIPELRNGVGKSVVFVDALLMVLFGKTTNSFNNKRLFNRASQDTLGWIKLNMEVNMQEYNIHCILTRSKRTGNVSLGAQLYKGEENEDNDISKGSKAQTLKWIEEEIIQTDCDTFRNSVILSTGNIQNFFQLQKGIKESYLDTIFKLVAFGEINTEVNKSLRSLKKDLNAQREILDTHKETYNGLKIKFDEFIKEKKAEIAILTAKVKKLKAEIKVIDKKIVNTEKLKEAAKLKQKEIDQYDKDFDALIKKSRALIDSPVDVSSELSSWSEERNQSLISLKDEVEKDIIIIENNKAEALKAVAQLNKDISDEEGKTETLRESIRLVNKAARDITDERLSLCGELKSLMDLKTKLDETAAILCEDCKKKTAKQLNFDEDRYSKLDKDNNDMFVEIEKLTSAEAELIKKLSKIESGMEPLDKNLIKLTDFIHNPGIDALNSKVYNEEALIEKETLKAEARFVSEARKQFNKDIEANIEKQKKITDAITVYRGDIILLNNQIEDSKHAEEQLEFHVKQATELATEFKKASDKENPFETLLKDSDDKVNHGKANIEAIFKDQRTNELLSNIYDENGVKRHIVSNIVTSLNLLIKKYLAEMGTDYTVLFNDKFQYTFYTITGECDYFDFSSGERRRLDMAVMLSFRDILFTNGFVSNLLIVDEVLDSGIDGYALFAILNILKNKTKDSNLSCVVISHRNEILEELSETFDHLMTVTKQNGSTSLTKDL